MQFTVLRQRVRRTGVRRTADACLLRVLEAGHEVPLLQGSARMVRTGDRRDPAMHGVVKFYTVNVSVDIRDDRPSVRELRRCGY